MAGKILNYQDFIAELLVAGFSMGGGNSEGIYAVVPWSWKEEPPYETPVAWHTEDLETDPWEWRMRVLDEGRDIAYGKLFFKKSGYITKDWYPHFLSVRRGTRSLADRYAAGEVSYEAKRIYEVITEYGTMPLHGIKAILGVTKEEKAKFDRALVELQMDMYLTMCGRQQKTSLKGEDYGWSSTVFCRTEDFFGQEVFDQAATMDRETAMQHLVEQIKKINPEAKAKKMERFITG